MKSNTVKKAELEFKILKEAEKRGLHYIEGNGECYYSVLKNENQLKEVYEYYVKS